MMESGIFFSLVNMESCAAWENDRPSVGQLKLPKPTMEEIAPTIMHLLANLVKDHRDRPLCARLLPVAPGGCKHPRRGEGNQRISRPRLKGSSRESSSAGSS
ncbi:unnamed protein product [Musa acuminata var. zebrina]